MPKNDYAPRVRLRQSCRVAKLVIMMDEINPVVLLTGNIWHIVEHSRRSPAALCGKNIQDRQAHARLNKVGVENICPKCRQRFEEK